MYEYDKAQTAQLKNYADKCCDKNSMPMPDQAIGYGPPVRVPLEEQLYKQIAASQNSHTKVSRALDILTRHPEFEEFLELQELINSGLYR